jgi:lipoate synthase
VLEKINRYQTDPTIYTKSSIMIGLGETDEEIIQTIADLRSAGVSIMTIGQYLQPTSRYLPVAEYVIPEKFNWFKEIAMQMGFPMCSRPTRSKFVQGLRIFYEDIKDKTDGDLTEPRIVTDIMWQLKLKDLFILNVV